MPDLPPDFALTEPRRSPRVCGALGSFDRERVLRAAALLDGALRLVHEDERSILLIDREPIRWGAGGEEGLGWIDGDVWRPPDGPLGGWEDAARHGLTGFVPGGRNAFLHTAVNGLAPLYWHEDGGATYFSSRIDPLVRSAGSRFAVDWDAWAATLSLRYPLGERTPFREIRRLPAHATLRRRWRAGRVNRPRWPWSEIEPHLSVPGAAAATVETLDEVLAPLPGGVTCPLSGGRDSRLLLLLLARDGRVDRAITVPDDEGARYEEEMAARAAALCGVEHEQLLPREGRYPADWAERARRVEYQFVDHGWLVPLASRIVGSPAPVPDGFAIDVLFSLGSRFYTPKTMDSADPRGARRELFDNLRRFGRAERALAPAFHNPLVARAREQFDASCRRFDGHASQALLAHYVTRSLRGTGTYSTGLLGMSGRIVAPGAADPVARAALAAHPLEKMRENLYAECFGLLTPGARGLPSTGDLPREAAALPRRWRSPEALAMHRKLLADGPLAPHLSPDLLAWLDAPHADPSPDLRLGMEAVSLMHAWWNAYRDVLGPTDAADLLG